MFNNMSYPTQEDVFLKFRNTNGKTPDDISRIVTIEALSEVIIENRDDNSKNDAGIVVPSPTEYFAAIMMVLGQGTHSLSQNGTLMFLFSNILNHIPKAVLRLKTDESLLLCMKSLKNTSNKGKEDENRDKIIKNAIMCIGKILGGQEVSKKTWDQPKNVQAFLTLMNNIANRRPKIRKMAQQAVINILNEHQKTTSPFELFADTCKKVMAQSSTMDSVELTRLVSFIETSYQNVSKFCPINKTSELNIEICKLMRLGNIQLAINSFRILKIFFETLNSNINNNDSDNLVKANKDKRVIKAIADIVEYLAEQMHDADCRKFIIGNAELCATWCMTLCKGEVVLYEYSIVKSDDVFQTKIDKVADSIIVCINAALSKAEENKISPSGFPQIAVPVGALVQVINNHKELMQRPDIVIKFMDSLEQVLTPRFEETWQISLDLLRTYFACIGTRKNNISVDSVIKRENAWILKLVSIRENVINPVTGIDKPKLIVRWRNALERTIGAAVHFLGVNRVLLIVPLRGDNNTKKLGIAPIRTWLIPILRSYIGISSNTDIDTSMSKSGVVAETSLEYFRCNILKIAEECENLSNSTEIGPNSAKMEITRALQLWSLLPSFCSNANDICQASGFRALVPVLEKVLSDKRYPELIEYICLGLKGLITKVIANTDEKN